MIDSLPLDGTTILVMVMVPLTGVEPVCLAALGLKPSVYPVPPQGLSWHQETLAGSGTHSLYRLL